uniref:Uncharacterized protein n=1 Tax=Arundo donax TaxID=35708 RepID=A0A0A9FJD5_ARUDO
MFCWNLFTKFENCSCLASNSSWNCRLASQSCTSSALSA